MQDASNASTPPGTHPRQYLVSRGQNILYPPKFVIVVIIIVNSVLTVHIIWRNGWRKNASKCTDLHVTIQNFSGGYAPEPSFWGNPISLGTPALRACPASLGPQSSPQCLLAVDATGRGCSICTMFAFDTAAPSSAPRDVTVTRSDDDVMSIRVRWRPPRRTNGDITGKWHHSSELSQYPLQHDGHNG